MGTNIFWPVPLHESRNWILSSWDAKTPDPGSIRQWVSAAEGNLTQIIRWVRGTGVLGERMNWIMSSWDAKTLDPGSVLYVYASKSQPQKGILLRTPCCFCKISQQSAKQAYFVWIWWQDRVWLVYRKKNSSTNPSARDKLLTPRANFLVPYKKQVTGLQKAGWGGLMWTIEEYVWGRRVVGVVEEAAQVLGVVKN